MSLTVWRISDGKAGHDSQSRGLCAALARQRETNSFDISIDDCSCLIPGLFTRRFPAADKLPDPDIIVSAGHGTHLPLLAATRARGGKSVVIMRPSLPLSWFDACLIPEHDNPPGRDNIITTCGAINDIQPSIDRDENLVLILLGGPSRHFEWNDQQVVSQVHAVCEHYPEKQIIITGSPRTPASLIDLIRPLQGEHVSCFTSNEMPRDQLLPKLTSANTIWVTIDSVSMIYEAMTATAAIGALELKANKNSRVARGITNLVDTGRITTFSTWQKTSTLTRNDAFNEADRCVIELGKLGLLE